MSRARAHLLASLLGIGLWAAWFLPALVRNARLPGGSAMLSYWAIHVIPLATLLLAPLLGLEVTFLLVFPAALVVPFAGEATGSWQIALPSQGGDLLLAAAAFLLYAALVPATLRKAGAPRLGGRNRPIPAADPRTQWLEWGLGLARPLAAALLPLILAYGAHFDRRIQLVLSDAFAESAPVAAVFLDLSIITLGVLASDLAFFGPLRGLRGKANADELPRDYEEQMAARGSPRFAAGAATVGAALLLLALAGYLAVRPK